MRSSVKVVTLLLLVGAALAAGEESEATTAAGSALAGEETKQTELKEGSGAAEDEGSTTGKNTEKRGLFRLTGVHGENPQPLHVVYTVQQPSPGVPQYDPRAAGASMVPKYEPYVKPYHMGYSAQPTFQQPYTLPSPGPFPFSGPTTMILLMMPPHPGNPYGSLMLVPANNLIPQYTPNHILPYQTPTGRIPIQLVPQFIPVPVKSPGYQPPGFPAAHFKTSEYSQKPSQQFYTNPTQYSSSPQQYSSNPQQYSSSPQQYNASPQQYSSPQQQYQEQPPSGSSEDQDQHSTSPPNYGSRVRPLEQYVKG